MHGLSKPIYAERSKGFLFVPGWQNSLNNARNTKFVATGPCKDRAGAHSRLSYKALSLLCTRPLVQSD